MQLPNHVEASLIAERGTMQRRRSAPVSNEEPGHQEAIINPKLKCDKPKPLKLKSGILARHSSFNESRDSDPIVGQGSPLKSRLGAQHINNGGTGHSMVEGIMPLKGVNLSATQGRLSLGNVPDGERYELSEEERWEYWRSPAVERRSGRTKQEGAMDGQMRGAWLAKGARAAERQWAAEDSLEDWKLSLKALAKLRELEGDAGTPGQNIGGSGFVAPTASPREDMPKSRSNNEPPTVPARASSADFKDAIRLSQRTSSQPENSRRSWDDRDLPRSIAELRDAIHVRIRPVPPSSPPPSPHHPSVVARLMGLDDLPKAALQPNSVPLNNQRDKKPSGEAKLLQQLLQYSPPASSATPSVSPSTPTSYSFTPNVSTQDTRNLSMRSELQSMLKRLEVLSLTGHANPSGVKFLDAISNYAKLHEPTAPLASRWEVSKPPQPVRLPAVKKPNQHSESLPVVVLKQSEEIRSPSPRSSQYNSDVEIEKRLRQLGLQSSEQERKTLKQILEAMQVKGLLRPPDSPRLSAGTGRQQVASTPATPRVSGSTSPACSGANGANAWLPSSTIKGEARPASHPTCQGKSESSASIVIMRPISRVSANSPPSHRHNLVSERATSPSIGEPRIMQSKTKSTISAEVNTSKESRSNGHHKVRSNMAIVRPPHVPSQPPTQPRKLSSKVRHGASRSGLPQTSPSGQSQKSRSAVSRSAGHQDLVSRRGSENHVAKDFDKIAMSVSDVRSFSEADPAQHSKIHVVDRRNESDCALQGTPPRECKADHSFKESEDCFTKDVTEQCSPVSVLDAHLSDNDVEQSPKFSRDANRALIQLQADGETCRSMLPEEWQQSQPGSPISVPHAAPIETLTAFASNAEALHTLKDSCSTVPLQEELLSPTASIKGVIQPDNSCDPEVANASSRDSNDWKIRGCMYEVFSSVEDNPYSDDELILAVRECLDSDMSTNCKENFLITTHDDAFPDRRDDEFRMENMEDGMDRYNLCNANDDDVLQDCWDDEEYCEPSSNVRDTDGDLVNAEDATWAVDNVCLSDMMQENLIEADQQSMACVLIGKGELHMDEGRMIKRSHIDESNVDFLYTDDVMRRVGLAGDEYYVSTSNCSMGMLDRWLAGGGKIPKTVFDELEEQWDAVHDAGIEGAGEDRDLGGELYRKSQQASMRRRLVFDCLDQILEARLSWVGMPVAGGHREQPVAQVWSDLKCLETGPASADDSMYAMLEQDLLKDDVDYSHATTCWRGTPTQLASVARDLENDLVDSLVLEWLNEGQLPPHGLLPTTY